MTTNQLSSRLFDHSQSEDHSPEYRRLIPFFREHPLDLYSTLSLKELGEAALLDRQETKFLFPEKLLLPLLNGLEADYQLLDIDGRRHFDYLSVYLDTPDRVLYQQHQAGARPRWKIRRRTYLNTGRSYWEVKRKDNRNLTHKTRQRIGQHNYQLLLVSRLLEITNYPGSITDLKPVLKTHYTRITLVHKHRQERITLDSRLSFSDGLCNKTYSNLVVVEIKQNRLDLRSPFRTRIKQIGGQPCRFSKYCLGSLLFDPSLKYNRFKPILHQIKSLNSEGRNHEWTL